MTMTRKQEVNEIKNFLLNKAKKYQPKWGVLFGVNQLAESVFKMQIDARLAEINNQITAKFKEIEELKHRQLFLMLQQENLETKENVKQIKKIRATDVKRKSSCRRCT